VRHQATLTKFQRTAKADAVRFHEISCSAHDGTPTAVATPAALAFTQPLPAKENVDSTRPSPAISLPFVAPSNIRLPFLHITCHQINVFSLHVEVGITVLRH